MQAVRDDAAMDFETAEFLAVLLVAALAPIVAALVSRTWTALVVPVVVVELLLGVLIGPDVLGLARAATCSPS